MLNLARAVAEYGDGKIQVVAFFPPEAPLEDFNPFVEIKGVETYHHCCFSKKGRNIRQLEALFTGRNSGVSQVFNNHGIDVVFESANFYGARIEQPCIAWFPDFQHRELPLLFSYFGKMKRDLGFKTQVKNNRHILVSSHDARKRCKKYYRVRSENITVLQFPGIITEEHLSIERREISRIYKLDEPFIFLPNQLWKHKNHEIVARALGILVERGTPVKVVSTGALSDPRFPNLFPNLVSTLKKNGAIDHFEFLGSIPRGHVVALMRMCACFLNPSRSEGWSTTIEEAKLFSVPMILSDLEVHREQASKNAKFFKPNNAYQLADLMRGMIEQSSKEEYRDLQCSIKENSINYGEAFTKLVYTVWDRHKK